MKTQYRAEHFFDPGSEELRYLPEGPRVMQNYPRGGFVLGWVAIQHGKDRTDGSINLLDLETGRNTSVPVAGRPGFFAETTVPGVVLAGIDRRLALVDLVTGRLEETGIEVTSDERVIINDGLAVDGGVLFGTKHLEFNLPIAALYFYNSGARTCHTLIPGQVCSNGKYLRRDATGATLIDIDSTPKTIGRYQLDATLERVIEQSLVVPPESLPAYPDGLRHSFDGESVVVAFYNPESISDGVAQQFRLSDGAVLNEWIIPGSPRVTCPEFVKIDGKVKIVFTTATEGMPVGMRELAPDAGHFFIADTPFTELPEAPPLVML